MFSELEDYYRNIFIVFVVVCLCCVFTLWVSLKGWNSHENRFSEKPCNRLVSNSLIIKPCHIRDTDDIQTSQQSVAESKGFIKYDLPDQGLTEPRQGLGQGSGLRPPPPYLSI